MKKIKYYLSTISRLLAHLKQAIPTIIILVFRQSFSKSNTTLVKFKDNTVFYIRNIMDLWILAETTINKDYELHGTKILPGWKVLDIGAAFGDFTVLAARTSANTQVYALEPLPTSFDLLQKNLAINSITNARVFQLALSSTSTSVQMAVNKVNFGNSQSANSTAGAVNVTALSLEKFMETNSIDQFDLIKSDCEGAEYDIFLGLSQTTLKKIKHIVMEYHLFHSESRHQLNKLKSYLSDNGFALKLAANPIHPDIGFLYATKNTQPSPLSLS